MQFHRGWVILLSMVAHVLLCMLNDYRLYFCTTWFGTTWHATGNIYSGTQQCKTFWWWNLWTLTLCASDLHQERLHCMVTQVCNRLCKAAQHCVQAKGSMSRLPEDVTFLLRIEVDNRECLSTSRWFTEYCSICMHANWMSNRNTISDCYIHNPRKILSLAPVEDCISR